MIEYTVTVESRIYHAKSYATFYGECTRGGDARQMFGLTPLMQREPTAHEHGGW